MFSNYFLLFKLAYGSSSKVITQAVRPGFKFRLAFFFFFPRSVTNRPLVFNARASPLHAYSTWNLQKLSSGKVSKDSFISRAMKSFPNKHTVRGRPTLKDVMFSEWVFSKHYERSIYERAFSVISYQVSVIKNQVILNGTKGSNNLSYQFFSLINGILRGVIIFLEVIVK